MQFNDIMLLPQPKTLEFKTGVHTLRNSECICISFEEKSEMFAVADRLKRFAENDFKLSLSISIAGPVHAEQTILFIKDEHLPCEAYKLDVDCKTVEIYYGGCAGAFHAVSTFKQLLKQFGKCLPCMDIEDEPDFNARGIMLDISRNRIPTMETLYRIVDLMSDVKLNQLQMYIEGYPFAYPSFPEIWQNTTPITGEEMIRLDRYCKERFIELVPNQNSFGHMAPWLANKAFNSLAECPEGCRLEEFGWDLPPFTLNPLDPQSIGFVKKLYDDLLPYFSSEHFNVGLDETLDLGQGKSKETCERDGKGRVYLDYMLKIYNLVKSRGKTMMFWGDIIIKHPELIPELPRDLIALEWGYGEEEPDLDHCKTFENSGIPFYVCPGTNSWNSITGFTGRMKKNLLNAAKRGRDCGAIGYLITDWGDGGHWQPLYTSYPGFCYAAALSWGTEQNEDIDIAAYLNRFVFKDTKGKMGRFVLDIANYYLKEKKTAYDGTGIVRALQFTQLFNRDKDLDFLNLPDIDAEDFIAVKQYVMQLINYLDISEMQCDDAEIIEKEYRNAIRLILHGVELGLFRLGTFEEKEKKSRLDNLIADLNGIIKDYKSNWLLRSRPGSLDESIRKMVKLKEQYIEVINDLK